MDREAHLMASLNSVLHQIVDLHNPDRRHPLHEEIDEVTDKEEGEEDANVQE